MRSEKLAYLDFYKSEFGVAKHCSKSFGYAVWNHRQTEVDELQKQLIDKGQRFNEQVQHVKDLEHKNAELQKRVDAVKKLIQDYKDEEKELELKEWEQSTIYGRIAIELEQALKGESNG
ncbi:hypothetical protein [Acinetobacter venetianus]|uniref:Uncharacterized protein n=1 Tax=Acinetobacter venetianus TaxID=52133 RepID=A0A150HYC8_9GAMM|nr:hypothetical protein [Acinetobacter venetianus]KXZ72165.1 hypothetical protein AVENLUH13518_00776 [Acinetobacter venetianus]